jgi:serine/threonine-protein kinase
LRRKCGVAASEPLLDTLTGAILDGHPIDWSALDNPAAALDPGLVRRLKEIAALADVHRADMPETWGHLRLLAPLGKGAFGEVYRAWDSRLDREVALKLIAADTAANDHLAGSIIEEGRLLARIHHPNVVTVYGAERIGDRIGLWMEYLSGRTLHQRVVENDERFSPAEVVRIGRDLCGAVGAVHAAGLVHRDIKAQNVGVSGEGRVVLMDFGAGRDRGEVRTAAIAGTPLYLAPEVLSGVSGPTVQSDIYSTGVLLYFLLTGTYPVLAQDVDSLRKAHERGERRAINAVRPGLPHRLCKVIARAIDPDPARRYPTAGALASALENVKSPALPGRTTWIAGALVVAAIAAAAMSRPEPGGTRRHYESNLEAYNLYLRGRHAMASFPSPGDRRIGASAIQYFEEAIGRDPSYAIAYAGLADALLSIDANLVLPELVVRGKSAAERALELDPMLSEAQSAVAAIRAREYDWEAAERGFRRAIELDPNNPLAHLQLGASVLIVQGRYEEGLEAVRRAAALDPLSPYVSTEFGSALLEAGRYTDAADQLRKAIALDLTRPRPYNLLGRALYLQGRTAEALKEFAESERRFSNPNGPAWMACAEMRAGAPERAAVLLQAQLKGKGAVSTRVLARTYACLGDEKRALDHLEKWRAEHAAGLPEMLQAPELAWMRTSPRFAMLRRHVNLAP